MGGGHHGNFWLWEQVGWWEPILLGAQGRPGRPWPPRGSYPFPFSVAQRGKEALPNLASPVSPPPSGNVSPGPTQDSASRPHPRALHPSCESMHQLPGWQAPRREPQGISGLEEFSSREHYSQAAGDGWKCSISGGDSRPGPTHQSRRPGRTWQESHSDPSGENSG